MAVTESGEVAGSVSGGCVRGRDRRRGTVDPRGHDRTPSRHLRLLRRRSVRRRPHLRWHDSPLHRGAGLVTEMPIFERYAALLAAEPVALVTVIEGAHVGAKLLVTTDGADPLGTLGHPELDRVAASDALAELRSRSIRRSQLRPRGPDHPRGPHRPADDPRVRRVARSATADVDLRRGRLHRGARTRGEGPRISRHGLRRREECSRPRRRFPMADTVRVTWPTPIFEELGAELGPRDAVCILTHDPKFDVPAVQGALATRVRLHRRDGEPQDPRQANGTVRRRGRRRGRDGAPDVADRATTSAPARRRRPRSVSARRSSPAGRARACRLPRLAGADSLLVDALRAGLAPRHRSVGQGGVAEAHAAASDRVDLDGSPGLDRVHDRIVDAEVEHHVTRVVDEVAGLGRLTVERFRLGDLRSRLAVELDACAAPGIGGEPQQSKPSFSMLVWLRYGTPTWVRAPRTAR